MDRFSDAESVTRVVRVAHVPALLVALAQATGDLSLLSDDLRPDATRVQEPHGGMSPDQWARGREVAASALEQLLVSGAAAIVHPDDDQLCRMMSFLAGEPVSDEYVQLLHEELGASDEDVRAPTWRKDDIDAERDLRVGIIGAGMSGLVAAHRLHQAGVPFVVLEKNADVGGTWFENRYPGCRVDVPNHLYSYSFFQRNDWPDRFSPQGVLLDYFRRFADELDLREHIRFGVDVVAAAFLEETGEWHLTLRTADGGEESLRVHAVISAVGQLNRPKLPDIDGVSSFGGRMLHSADWDSTVDLTGKRVAVVGTGASGIQAIPVIAESAAEVHVYQRTPSWFMPAPDYHAAVPDEAQWLLRNVPFYTQWYRLSLFWRLAEGALAAARVEEGWEDGGRSVGERNQWLRMLLTQYLESQFADAPQLLEQVLPAYPPLAKRMLLDNGIWASTLKRENVELITDRIERITEHGIVADGELREVDVIVLATGFEASSFLSPMRITGRGGVDLHEQWDGDARAYLGLTIPQFPNLFCLYGPNTNLVANGSIIFFSECEVQYVLGCLRLLLERGAAALDCRAGVYDAYNEWIDDGNARMAWGAATVNSWYRNANGRITQNWPFTLLEFWRRTRRPDEDDYDLLQLVAT
ncbi:MAG: 4-hydroxyacetophenone monooxygenase [Acidimicrobiaceae bacterium]